MRATALGGFERGGGHRRVDQRDLPGAPAATAGLIGNTLVALAANHEVRKQVTADPRLLREAILEILRYDPPVQNTRRFVATDGLVAGEEMKEGDGILVVLAAANRDPAANPNPDRFDLIRENRRVFTLGAGVHACPGEALATTIAQAGIEQLLHGGLDLERFSSTRAYRPSVNGRIPFGIGSRDQTHSSTRVAGTRN